MRVSRRDLMTSSLALAAMSVTGAGGSASAQVTPASPRETILLWPSPPQGQTPAGGPEVITQTSSDPNYSSRYVQSITNPRIEVFPAANPNGAAMLIIPGGGFGMNFFEHEGYYVAEALSAAGITCFVLFYRLANEGWADRANVGPADAQRAMRVIRSEATRFGIDPARVGVMGFSAGGFLTATLATRHAASFYAPVDAKDELSARPIISAPVYPVQSIEPEYAYGDTARSLFGGPATAEQIQTWQPDLNVDAYTSPTFLVHAEDDTLVKVENSTRFRDALIAKSIPVETHLFAKGGHGLGIPGDPGGRKLWIPLFLNFARSQGLLV